MSKRQTERQRYFKDEFKFEAYDEETYPAAETAAALLDIADGFKDVPEASLAAVEGLLHSYKGASEAWDKMKLEAATFGTAREFIDDFLTTTTGSADPVAATRFHMNHLTVQVAKDAGDDEPER